MGGFNGRDPWCDEHAQVRDESEGMMRVWREGVTDSRSAVPRISHAHGKRDHVIETPTLVTGSCHWADK
jgi:hypothetical protein